LSCRGRRAQEGRPGEWKQVLDKAVESPKGRIHEFCVKLM